MSLLNGSSLELYVWFLLRAECRVQRHFIKPQIFVDIFLSIVLGSGDCNRVDFVNCIHLTVKGIKQVDVHIRGLWDTLLQERENEM